MMTISYMYNISEMTEAESPLFVHDIFDHYRIRFEITRKPAH